MNHCIIAKFSEGVQDKPALIKEIKALFSSCDRPAEIEGITIHENCIDRANRYDIMIVIQLAREALPVWDECSLHKRWKSEFGEQLASKAIFDYED